MYEQFILPAFELLGQTPYVAIVVILIIQLYQFYHWRRGKNKERDMTYYKKLQTVQVFKILSLIYLTVTMIPFGYLVVVFYGLWIVLEIMISIHTRQLIQLLELSNVLEKLIESQENVKKQDFKE